MEEITVFMRGKDRSLSELFYPGMKRTGYFLSNVKISQSDCKFSRIAEMLHLQFARCLTAARLVVAPRVAISVSFFHSFRRHSTPQTGLGFGPWSR